MKYNRYNNPKKSTVARRKFRNTDNEKPTITREPYVSRNFTGPRKDRVSAPVHIPRSIINVRELATQNLGDTSPLAISKRPRSKHRRSGTFGGVTRTARHLRIQRELAGEQSVD